MRLEFIKGYHSDHYKMLDKIEYNSSYGVYSYGKPVTAGSLMRMHGVMKWRDTTYVSHMKTSEFEARSSCYTEIDIDPETVRIGNRVISCYPKKITPIEAKQTLYDRITRQIPEIHHFMGYFSNCRMVIRPSYEAGPSKLLVRFDGAILDAYVNERNEYYEKRVDGYMYDVDGNWLPEYEYLIREGRIGDFIPNFPLYAR